MSATGTWRPALGAIAEAGRTRFRVWARGAARVEVVLESDGRRVPMAPAGGGCFEAVVPGIGAGDRYRLAPDGRGPFPDPASRFQPEGVHGPSEVVDPARFAWSDGGGRAVSLEQLVLYELHVGAFTAEGTFRAAAGRLGAVRELGVTALELMPVAAFPGRRNWGYDGAALFAPAAAYGAPDDLRRLVDAAHGLGLAVLLDVVYNHLGPDGAYLPAFSPAFFTGRAHTPWGEAVNLQDEHAAETRAFLVENALYWLHEYHLDGLRLDATHALVDESPRHFLAQLSEEVRRAAARPVLLVAEDARNLARVVRPVAEGGWGMDAVWADDFHHLVRRRLAGDRHGYYMDYSGSAADLALTIRRGWLFTGQQSAFWRGPRGSDPAGIPPPRFVFCVQNHDQIGNRALGERLAHQIAPAAYRAASALLLLVPETPLLFMGQEWAASTPFLFFTDHAPELGPRVTEGRRREFQEFPGFADPAARARIPDPQAPETFERSRLAWDEREREPHAGTLRLYRALLELRRALAVPLAAAAGAFDVAALDAATLALRRRAPGLTALVVVRLEGAGAVDLPAALLGHGSGPCGEAWQVWLTSEDAAYAPGAAPPRVELGHDAARVHFTGPAAVVLRGTES